MSGFVNFSVDDEDVNLEYLYNIGLSHAKRGSPRDAIFYFDKVLDAEPNHANALANKGNALGKLGKYDQAITCYDKILEQTPVMQVPCITRLALDLFKMILTRLSYC